MNCPSCGTKMDEVSKWELAPFGGYKCPSCGLTVNKKTSSKTYKIIKITSKQF